MKLSNYYLPTPKKWRKIGDSLLGCATLITGGGLLAFDQLAVIFTTTELRIVIGSAFIIGVVGKFITNIVKVDEVVAKTDK
jgi:hypothetical protein